MPSTMNTAAIAVAISIGSLASDDVNACAVPLNAPVIVPGNPALSRA